MPQKFLDTVSRYYSAKDADLAGITFICPNKRSAMFLKMCFQRHAGDKPVFMPRFAALNAWIARIAPRRVPDRWEALFVLYDSYRAVLARHGREGQASDFDRFIFWGDIIISDFDDIDRSLADAGKVYENLSRLRSIQADYLTDEQKAVIRLLWGDTPLTREIDSFWLHMPHRGEADDDNTDSVSRRFVALWEILGELYTEFRARLAERDMATKGMVSRLALNELLSRPLDEIAAEGRRYVFTGLSDIYPAELAILERMRDAGVAEFIWDTAIVDALGAKDAPTGLASVSRVATHLPPPPDFPALTLEGEREISIIGVPSAVGQAKEAAEIISSLCAEGSINPANAINTAVVLTDPSLLMPLMLALPEELQRLNVTMSIPYSESTFATLLRCVVSLQARIRKRRGKWTFYYADVLEIMAHPHVRVFAPESSERLRKYVSDNVLYNIDAESVIQLAPELDFIFRPVAEPYDVHAVYDYLSGFINGLYRALRSRITAKAAGASIELMCLESLRDRLDTLLRLGDTYNIEMGESTLFMIFERLLNSGILTVQGTPLKGLQIMGPLETRALDFDNIIFLSVNEGTFPPRDKIKTIIPAALRRGYGLPAIDHEETAMNYHFYRALSRAHHTWLLYDTRPASLGGTEVSRYITQMLYGPASKLPGLSVNSTIVELAGSQPSERTITVPKTAAVLAELESFRRAGGRNISASALKTYMACPLNFYLQYVKGFRADEPPTDYLTPAEIGDILHGAMQELYRPYRGAQITEEIILDILNSDRIRATLLDLYARKRPVTQGLPYEELPGEGKLVIAQIELQIRTMLQAEMEQYVPFTYFGGEEDGGEFCQTWEIVPGLRINFKMKIDRIDRTPDGAWRFIDYKTGSDKITAGITLKNLFNGDHDQQAIFQLMLYREAFDDFTGNSEPVDLRLHIIKEIMKSGEIGKVLLNGKPLSPDLEARVDFRTLLGQLISEIFDPEIPFKQAKDDGACKFCRFKSMCNKALAAEN